MRFSYAEAMTDPTFYIPLAKAAEAAGYHAMTIADSIAYPFESDSRYPYTPDGNREFLLWLAPRPGATDPGDMLERMQPEADQ